MKPSYQKGASGQYSIVVSINGKAKSIIVDTAHPNYTKIEATLRRSAKNPQPGDSAEILRLFDVAAAVQAKLGTKAQIVNGQVFFNGKEVHSSLATRIQEALRDGFPVDGLLLFMENLHKNPSARAVAEMFDFLNAKGLPITEDGCFLAYKGVGANYMDLYRGTFDNTPGKKPRMARNEVDDDRAHECSYGLHVGRLEYARNYCGSGGKIVLVKVSPEDVVAVPKDYNCSKMRVTGYEVISDYSDTEVIQAPVTSSNGTSAKSSKSALKAKTEEFMEIYGRDEAVDAAVVEGLFETKKAARTAGKATVCERLAMLELGLIEPEFA